MHTPSPQMSPLTAWNRATWVRLQFEQYDDGSPEALDAITHARLAEQWTQHVCELHAQTLSVDAHGLTTDDRRAIQRAHDARVAGAAV